MPSRITKRGRVRWQARVQKDGEIRRKICETKKEALDWETEQRDADWTIPTDFYRVIDWANHYLDFAATKYTSTTFLEKKTVFRRLFQSIDPAQPTEKLKPGQALDFLQHQAQTRSGHAANKDRKNLLAGWNWGIKYLGLHTPNPFLVEKFPEKRKPRYIPSEEDFWKVYEIAQGQDRVMLAVALYTAARRGEIFGLTWPDIDFINDRIRLSTRKRRDGSLEYDWLPMTAALKNELLWWQQNRTFKQSSHVFLNESQYQWALPHYGQPFTKRLWVLEKLCNSAGVTPFTWHAIRHLTASILYRQGEKISRIQAILRHRSPTTTERYLRSLGLEDVREALNNLDKDKPKGKVIPLKQKPPRPKSRGQISASQNQTVSKTVSGGNNNPDLNR